MKIMFISFTLTGGGAERVMSVLANECQKKGDDVYVLLYNKSPNEYILNENITKIYISPYEKTKRNGLVGSVHYVLKMRKFIKKVKPDYVISFLANIPVYFATIRLNTKFISTIRIDPRHKNIKSKLRDFAIKKSDCLIVQNNEQLEYFEKIIKKKFVLYNPVSDSFLKTSKEYNPYIRTIVTAGRLTEQKNHKLLIDAVSMLHVSYPFLNLSIYGEGPLYNELNNYINSIDANSYITLQGRCNNMPSILEKSDLFVLSSNYEGMPNALIEAMAVGVPSISTECPTGPKTIISHGENGWLCGVNELDELINLIKHAIDNPIETINIGINGKKFIADNFEVENVVNKFHDILSMV